MRRALLQALEDKYNAEISNADATIQIYLNNSVGIGEHPQHLEEIDKLIKKLQTHKIDKLLNRLNQKKCIVIRFRLEIVAIIY